MATLARWQRTITDEDGNVIPNASVEVRTEAAGNALVQLYDDRDGLVLKASPTNNPFSADSDGFAFFHIIGGAYKITATDPVTGTVRIWRYVGVGTQSEQDRSAAAISPTLFKYETAVADADPTAGYFRFNNANPALATAIYVDNLNTGGGNVANWLNTFDDFGASAFRGILEISDPSKPANTFYIFQLTGTVVDGPNYKKLTVTYLSGGVGSISANQEFLFAFFSRGPSGVLSAVVDDPAPTLGGDLSNGGFDINMTGGDINMLSGGNIFLDNGQRPLSQGLHTIGLQAGGMIAPTFQGAALTTAGLSASAPFATIRTMDFDPNNEEEVQFDVPLPKSWNGQAIIAEYLWTATTGSGSVVWQMALAVFSEGDPLEAAYGTAVNVTDTLTVVNDLHVSPRTANITPSGTPADDSYLRGRITREVTDPSDTIAADVKLLGIRLFIVYDLPNDA